MSAPAVFFLCVLCVQLAACRTSGGLDISGLETSSIAPLTAASGDIVASPGHSEEAPSPETSKPPVFSIANDRGGPVIVYAARMMKWREAGATVKFVGRCDSACTLYLALPSERTCIAPGTVFRFHAPAAPSRREREIALTYLMKTYPDWVRQWIASKGGLARHLITMNYDYAHAFLRSCEPKVAKLPEPGSVPPVGIHKS